MVLKSSMPSFKSTIAGVPQGSILWPMLFLIYVNDISESLLSLTRLFADDSSLFYSASNIQDIDGIINNDLQVLTSWAKQWLIHFNPQKTEALLFTLKQIERFPNSIFNNIPIQFVEAHKQHINQRCKNCRYHAKIKIYIY